MVCVLLDACVQVICIPGCHLFSLDASGSLEYCCMYVSNTCVVYVYTVHTIYNPDFLIGLLAAFDPLSKH